MTILSLDWDRARVDAAFVGIISPFPVHPTIPFNGWACHQLDNGLGAASCQSCTHRLQFPYEYEDTEVSETDEDIEDDEDSEDS